MMRRYLLRLLSVSGVFSIVLPIILLFSLATTGTGYDAQAQGQLAAETQAAPEKDFFDYDREQSVVAYNQHNLIRFHIIANSDSEKDQALKRRIRDLVVEKMNPEFKKAANLADAQKIALAHLGDIETIARDEIKQWHESYPVKAELGNFDFPIKSYGALTLPAGNYEAVRVVIGEGQGANWWCVLFPPLCFGDVSKGMAPLKVPDAKAVKAIQSKGAKTKAKPPVKVRFKILETFGFYKESR